MVKSKEKLIEGGRDKMVRYMVEQIWGTTMSNTSRVRSERELIDGYIERASNKRIVKLNKFIENIKS